MGTFVSGTEGIFTVCERIVAPVGLRAASELGATPTNSTGMSIAQRVLANAL